MKFSLNTGRTIRQGTSVESKYIPEYEKEVSRCEMNPMDMMEIGVEEGERVLVTGSEGEIVLVVHGDESLPRCEVFIPYGPYANHLTPVETHGTGMPDFKNLPVDVTATDRPVKGIKELIRELGGVPFAL
ncbi:MAG: molybdopterin dinucleotide-binding protein [Methanomicrobiales archaeon]|nr:molybdopterin dinucleotide-binding protein [Methanomicrobiales archaeon]